MVHIDIYINRIIPSKSRMTLTSPSHTIKKDLEDAMINGYKTIVEYAESIIGTLLANDVDCIVRYIIEK